MVRNSLIFVRHSQVLVDTAVSANQWRLSENGRFLCHKLAHQLAPHRPTRIVTSTEPKAVETGQILAETLNLAWETAENLHEHQRDDVPFYSREQFEAVIAEFFARPTQLIFGQETAEQTRQRFETAVSHLLTRYPQDTLAIVTHGTALTLFLAHHNSQLDPFVFWKSLQLPDFVVVSLPNMKLQNPVPT